MKDETRSSEALWEQASLTGGLALLSNLFTIHYPLFNYSPSLLNQPSFAEAEIWGKFTPFSTDDHVIYQWDL